MGQTSTDSFLIPVGPIDATITHLATSQITFDQAALCCQFFLGPVSHLNYVKGVGGCSDLLLNCGARIIPQLKTCHFLRCDVCISI